MSTNKSTGKKKRFALVALAACVFLCGTPCLADDDAYPHITTLEKAILGKAYPADDLTARLARMEVKAFGKASTDSDLSQRTDDLEDYSQKTLHQKPFGAGSAYDVEQREAAGETIPDAAGAAPSSPPTEYPHITSLEKSILDQTFPGQPLPDRLARMEEKAFGKASSGQDLSDRTDALEGYAQKTLHKKAFAQEQKQEAAAYGGVPVDGAASGGGSAGGNGQSKLLNFVGNSLLGMAGGALMPGFGGVRMRPRMPQDGGQAQAQPAVEVRPDDPAVSGAEPPPVGAKMQTQVGWCEVQLFGHTFPAMHLPDRLKQINTELNYAPGKSPIALMDDVGGLIKAVQAKKKGAPRPTM
ncbi:MAG: hypothetical protein JSS83_25175 [Cyanobacteria bacterium SZAS LIN-3]|nr:hypothetical protein [Cyanobacteria bacterium SZAS LIN-3]MBS2005431.1 hypothetical protein [Cyanobacteria bacterium SZAS TMP-1]